MIRLIYVSRATKKMSQEELVSLLEQSREKNKKLGLSGMLLYGGGNFFQIIEGEKEEVESLYKVILEDERHKDCVLIDNAQITQKDFADWSMGFEMLKEEDISRLDGYSEFLTRNMHPDEIAQTPNNVISLLYSFKRSI